jgi:hypothetical protein
MFVIGHRRDGDSFWNDDVGWVSIDRSSRYTEEEKSQIPHLPLDGYWVPLWSVDFVQFARFITEAEACGVFENTTTMQSVADSMDLSLDQVMSIVDRAQNRWAEMVQRPGLRR